MQKLKEIFYTLADRFEMFIEKLGEKKPVSLQKYTIPNKENIDSKYDILEWEIADIYEEHEYGKGSEIRCVFYINGQDLLDITNQKGAYNHIIYDDFYMFAFTQDILYDINDKDRNRILLLGSYCDKTLSGNLSVKVIEQEKSIVWDDFMLNDTPDYPKNKSGLSFEFEINQYKEAMSLLKKELEDMGCR